MPRKGQYKNRVGEIHTMHDGHPVTIIECFGNRNVTLQYEDNTILKKVRYECVTRGEVRKPLNLLGNRYVNNAGFKYTVTEFLRSDDITVEFENGVIKKHRSHEEIKKGNISNPYEPTVHGVGYWGVGKYDSSFIGYKNWVNMITRTSSKLYKTKRPTYNTATVCEEWKCLQNFGAWYEENWKPGRDNWHVDKDILIKGNKHYSPETCRLVPQEINSLFIKANGSRGKYLIGVNKVHNRYCATICTKQDKKDLGSYLTELGAFYVYKTAKERHIRSMADEWSSRIDYEVYEAMYNYRVEKTD